jgi:hypothetical protein
MQYWICHWQNRYWKHDINPEGKLLRSSGSNMFSKRKVGEGDFIYVVSIRNGVLLLGGRMRVGKIVPRAEAVKIRRTEQLFGAA